MSPVSSSETLCINSSSRMWLASSGMMAELVIKFTGDSVYCESLSLPLKLVANTTSPSGLAVNLGVASGPFVGRVRFEFIFPLPMSVGVAVLEAAVSVSAWAAPELAGKAGYPDLSVRMLGNNSGVSG